MTHPLSLTARIIFDCAAESWPNGTGVTGVNDFIRAAMIGAAGRAAVRIRACAAESSPFGTAGTVVDEFVRAVVFDPRGPDTPTPGPPGLVTPADPALW